MVLVVVASQHAHKLANLQMDFVASVSHELRTPLAVILSAGENIRDGLPEDPKEFMQQGSVITEQANQLMELVDQVLRFSSLSKAVSSRASAAIQISTLIDAALRNTAEVLQKEAFRVEKRVAPDLPNVVGDLSGLTQSIQNLIINAVKYSEQDRWIGISAETAVDENGRPEVQVSVTDHGAGIASSEFRNIFQPFYRSPRAVSAQVRGTGLGLAIAKHNAEAFGGRLSVTSELGVGSSFTLHLPLADEGIDQAPMRPDLFEQHTVHFHGYPNASSFYDGVPDASVAINIGGSFTYYYLAPDAGTYFWHCHITPPEHLQMGMVGQIYVRPRQNRVTAGGSLYAALQQQQLDNRTKCDSNADILCSNPLPATSNSISRASSGNYAYNDGDGSTYYDVEYPIQIHGFDPNFHFVGMADTYNSLVPGNTLTISDPGQGVIANDTNVSGVQLLAAPAAGKVTLNSNGTFTYVPNSGTTADSFTYCANGSVTGTTCARCPDGLQQRILRAVSHHGSFQPEDGHPYL